MSNMQRSAIILFALCCLPLRSALAFEWPNIQPKQIGAHSYVIEHGPHDEPDTVSYGFHNNPGFIITNTGVVVVDTGSSYEIGKMILRKIRTVTQKPITHIFTTHFHGDHWLANQALVEAYPDVSTIAHPELIKLLKSGEDQAWLDIFTKRLGEKAFAGTRAVIPNTAAQNQAYKIGGLTFEVMLFDKAHTATDLMVYVVEDGILFTGDIVNNQHFSFMGHGNFKGAYDATQMALAKKPKYVVVGHGKSGQPELINEYSYLYKTLRELVRQYQEQGLQDYEMKPKIVKALDKYKDYSGFETQLGRYISQVMLELEAEAF